MIDVLAIRQIQDETVVAWHEKEIENTYSGFEALVCEQHEQNFRLWHQEDIARSPTVADHELAEVKRRIDRFNQRRNDLIEKLDDVLLARLAMEGISPCTGAEQNSETPGSIIDRLSIISLRIFHMEEQAVRKDVETAHRTKALARLEILYEQRADLTRCLELLLNDLFAGRKRLKVYRQFKMYNDPTLNPYLYQKPRAA